MVDSPARKANQSTPIPEHIRLLTPWQELSSSRGQEITLELYRELGPGHLLYGVQARAIAARIDSDDVLCELSGHPKQLAVIHLTWGHKQEINPQFPFTKLFVGWDEFIREQLLRDHEMYRE